MKLSELLKQEELTRPALGLAVISLVLSLIGGVLVPFAGSFAFVLVLAPLYPLAVLLTVTIVGGVLALLRAINVITFYVFRGGK